jgi:hypothetical protein
MIRTTLTLDEDLARTLRDEARRTGQAFRDVVNASLRRGLQRGGGPAAPLAEPPAHSLGLGPEAAAISANKLNDLIETEHLAAPRSSRP